MRGIILNKNEIDELTINSELEVLRPIKFKNLLDSCIVYIGHQSTIKGFHPESFYFRDQNPDHIFLVEIPNKIGELLYVRETWNYGYLESNHESKQAKFLSGQVIQSCEEDDYRFVPVEYRKDKRPPEYGSTWVYKADETDNFKFPKNTTWKPSTCMPKSAARLFAKVKAIDVVRNQEIDRYHIWFWNIKLKREILPGTQTDNKGRIYFTESLDTV